MKLGFPHDSLTYGMFNMDILSTIICWLIIISPHVLGLLTGIIIRPIATIDQTSYGHYGCATGLS
jgi:hypothetical protein